MNKLNNIENIKNNIKVTEHVATYENGFKMYQVKANGERIKVCLFRGTPDKILSTEENIFQALEDAFEEKNKESVKDELSEQQEEQAKEGSYQEVVFAKHKDLEKVTEDDSKELFLKIAKTGKIRAREIRLANLEYFRKLKKEFKNSEELQEVQERYMRKHELLASKRGDAFYKLMDLGKTATSEDYEQAIFELRIADILLEDNINIMNILEVDMLSL